MAVVSVANGWPVEVLDIGAAFLKGMTFAELKAEGLRRQPVAFTPDDELWWILGSLDPEITKAAAQCAEPTMEMDKCGHGL